MTRTETPMSDMKYLDGDPSSDSVGAPNVVLTHVNDLHGQLRSGNQVYYNNETSKPPFDFGKDDRVIKPGGGISRLAAKLNELREEQAVRTLMSGDTFHDNAGTTYQPGVDFQERGLL